MDLSKEDIQAIDDATSDAIGRRKLPVWILSSYEEKTIRKRLKEAAWKRCDEWVAEFVACSKNAGLLIFPKCDSQRFKLHDCLKYYQKDGFVDEQIDIHLKQRLEKMEKKYAEQQATKKNENNK
ncbi:related to COX assembly mitochondrial protein [Hanseniaspora guilliermondii]|uniref:COX assembly mitochondrial protein n=1 Tax=Hanseniaspora guilliermondii TaxID=56406 RepID=A0A1L0B264_9ASCO|nr:related to COX assembly mitochondrial protein [Hanseniaspora guilliermondii]